MNLRLTNSRGRVLLEVTGAYPSDTHGVLYTYSGDGCGGCVSKDGLYQTIHYIRLDAPSAKLTGTLPEPVRITEGEN